MPKRAGSSRCFTAKLHESYKAETFGPTLTSGRRSWPLLVNAAPVQSPQIWHACRGCDLRLSEREPGEAIDWRGDVLELAIGAGASVGSPAVAQRRSPISLAHDLMLTKRPRY